MILVPGTIQDTGIGSVHLKVIEVNTHLIARHMVSWCLYVLQREERERERERDMNGMYTVCVVHDLLGKLPFLLALL